jgi:bifunctional DNA-binding transcriptional regulator/antitoxin component of YhaV-PrlF toxin-antitoxin module
MGLTHFLKKAKVSNKGQLSLPNVVCTRFDIEQGDQLVFYDNQGLEKLDQLVFEKYQAFIVLVEKSAENEERKKENPEHYL